MMHSVISQAKQMIARDRARKALARSYQSLWTDPEGRLVIEDVLRAGGLLEVAHTPGDAHTTAFNDGRRSVALHVLNRLRWSEGELVALANAQTRADLEEAMSEG